MKKALEEEETVFQDGTIETSVVESKDTSRNEPGVPLDKSYILSNCNNAIIYDFTPAYLKPPL
jgi:hypothetical protein